jgi:hypothetical protein
MKFIKIALGALALVLQSILGWFAQRNWTNWNAWAAVGQMLGALATVWTARLALHQIKDARRQEEESREREIAAMEPELTPRSTIRRRDREKVIHLILSNNKPVPVFVDSFKFWSSVPFPEDDRPDDVFETEAPERVPYGDVCVTKIPVDYLLKTMMKHDVREGTFKFFFSLANGKKYTFSILVLEKRKYECSVYMTNQHYTTKEENIEKGKLIHHRCTSQEYSNIPKTYYGFDSGEDFHVDYQDA